MMIKFLFIFLLAAPGAYGSQTATSALEYMTLTYSQVDHMKSNFSKKSTSTLLGSTEKSSGDLEYSKGKFRLNLKGKTRNVFIKGEKNFWHLNGNEVIKGDVSKAVPTVFEAIFSDPKIWSEMKSEFVKKGKKIIEIKVETKGKVPNISQMVLKINNVKKTLERLSYVDDVNNAVEINFKNIRFFPKSKPERFKYTLKKTDKISKM